MKKTTLYALALLTSIVEAKPLVDAEVYLKIHGNPHVVKEKICTADLLTCDENEYVFNKQAQLLSESFMINDSDNEGKMLYEYDSEGRVVVNKYYSAGELHSESRVTVFNNDKQALEMTYRSLVQPNSNALIVFSYNDAGQLLSMESKKWNQSTEYKRILVYEMGKKVAEETYDGDSVSKSLYTYNDKGFENSETQISANGNKKVINYAYLYDELGNWIEKTAKQNGEIIEITKRDIQYYL